MRVLEPVTASRYSGGVYYHLYPTCPAVRAAIKRDGHVNARESSGEVEGRLCGVCRRWRDAEIRAVQHQLREAERPHHCLTCRCEGSVP